ncbi:hypothetical protein [Kitasatospora sp. KL5]|uniref:hypothetical protein n=1 Tax=Kitasatospora sp. KL5 TaxID=3425125 RepID=UPI003D6F81B9
MGPLLLTGVMMTAGPFGWIALGAAAAGLGLVQRRAGLRRLTSLRPLASGRADRLPARSMSS